MLMNDRWASLFLDMNWTNLFICFDEDVADALRKL